MGKLVEGITDGFMQLSDKYGLEVGIVIAIAVLYHWILFWSYKQVVKSKDDEIERLVENRNKLQDAILRTTSRLSTGRKKKK